ncbi:lytic transglycosylase domain-containing protein [Parafrankia elaeagni]|uniref:lytic transglycosylase domain-containing protein n=1 Tax=Parafrankia elaeagni TaxID=222534 RepID=UPI0003779BE3|nr:lytic murein transglycosylase [Parafrankia elaeagni]
MRAAVLPVTLATGVLLCCAAAVPREPVRTSDINQQPPRPGVWAVPDLVRNGTIDPSTLSTSALAAAAAQAAAAATGTAATGADSGAADSGAARGAAGTTGRSSSGSGATPVTLSAGATGIPARVLAAYTEAADQLAADLPGCHLPWELLAAIGRVESGHAAGRPLAADGTVTRPILGPALNGLGDVALIRDTDDGALDGDARYDRAVGPMQFIPTTWAGSGRDGNGDGRRDPHNIHDATLAAGHYLCAHGRDLADPAQLRAAIHSYNPSDAYVRSVLTWMAGYRQGGATAQPGGTSVPDALSVTLLTPNAVPPAAPATAPSGGTPIPTAPASTAAPVPTAVPTPNPSPEIPSSSPGGAGSSPAGPSPNPGSPGTPVPPPSAPPSATPAPGAMPVQPASPTEQPAPAPTRPPSSPNVPTEPPSPPASPSSPPPAAPATTAPATTAVATPSPTSNPASTLSSADNDTDPEPTDPEPTVSEPGG